MNQTMSKEGQQPTGPEHSVTVYRNGDLFVNALAQQLTVPDVFFDVHHSLDRSAQNKDIQDPKTWVGSVTPKDGAESLQAVIDVPGKLFTKFSSDGSLPENIRADSREGTYVSLLLGEARLKAVRSAMPDAYATGRHQVDKAIKATQKLRQELVSNPKAKDLQSLLFAGNKAPLGARGKVNVEFAAVV